LCNNSSVHQSNLIESERDCLCKITSRPTRKLRIALT